MNQLTKLVISLLCMTFLGFTQQTIPNVQFTDLKGKTYDLYEELAKGKHILVHATGSR